MPSKFNIASLTPSFFARDISQETLIKNVNQYLSYHNLPLQWNPTGVCNGLAHVHAYYYLTNQEKLFFDLLTQISKLKPGSQLDLNDIQSPLADLNHFITLIERAFSPSHYDTELRQHTSAVQFKMDQRNFKASGIFSIIQDAETWAEILKAINMKPGEFYVLTFPHHAVSLYKTNEGYALYNPNHSQGKRYFKDEQSLLRQCFSSDCTQSETHLAISIHQISHPNNKVSAKPCKAALFKKHASYDIDALKMTIPTNKKAMPNYIQLLENNNITITEKILEHPWSNQEILSMLTFTFQNRFDESASVLIKQIAKLELSEQNKMYVDAITYSFRYANTHTLSALTKDCEQGKRIFNLMLIGPKNVDSMLANTASSGNSELMLQLFEQLNRRLVRTSTKKLPEQNTRLKSRPSETDLLISEINHLLSDIQEKTHPVSDSIAFEPSCQPDATPEQLNQEAIFAEYSILKENLTNHFERTNTERNMLAYAVDSENPECLKTILTICEDLDIRLSLEQYSGLLTKIIRLNQPIFMDLLLSHCMKQDTDMQTQLVQSVSINPYTAKQTNGHILDTLKNHGAEFNESTESIRLQKQSHHAALLTKFWLWIVTLLNYFSLKLGCKTDINFNFSEQDNNPINRVG